MRILFPSLAAALLLTLVAPASAAARPEGVSAFVGLGTYTAMKTRHRSRRAMMRAPGTSGGPPTSTPGAPAGSSGGNAATGSGAAPSGK